MKKHFVRPENLAEEVPGMIVRTACLDFDYVGPDGTASFDWTGSLDEVDSVTCTSCAAIARLIKLGMEARS